jgi:glycosyltransferase involved in cell wall biosynthesis
MTCGVVVVTNDLQPNRAELMPWRTIIEVVRGMRKMGKEAWLVSISTKIIESSEGKDFDIPVWFCRSIGELHNSNKRYRTSPITPELVYWPVTWRSGLYRSKQWHGWSCPTITYLGGGYYTLRQALSSIRWMNYKSILPYLLEAIAPKGLLVGKLREHNARGIITMTDFNRRALIHAGWPEDRIDTVPPGIDRITPGDLEIEYSDPLIQIIKSGPYILFMGNSQPIRGINVLLDTADFVFSQNREIRIICLFRKDGGDEMAQATIDILHRRERLKHKDRFICITDKLNQRQVAAAVSKARAVALPFLFVPSEIPLSILEAMWLGTPVIVTDPGGTSEFVGDAGWIVPPGNSRSLAGAMLSAIQEDDIRYTKSQCCLKRMKSHPSWDSVARTWLDFGLRSAGLH